MRTSRRISGHVATVLLLTANAFGQLSDGTVSDRAAPVQVAGVN